MSTQDPHEDLHQMAGADTKHDHPVQADGEDWRTELDKLNKTLTKRINDLRTDTDTFKTATSKSVAALAADVSSARTAIQNNKDAIEAQDALIEEAKTAAAAAAKKADAASAAAKQATDAAAAAAQKAEQVEEEATKLGTDLQHLTTRYENHGHKVETLTGPPTTGEAE